MVGWVALFPPGPPVTSSGTLFGANWLLVVARLFVAEKQNFRGPKPKEKGSRGGGVLEIF